MAKAIGAGLYKAACAGRWKGETVDLRTPLEEDGELEILTFQEAEGKHAYWHTASHVMAQAVKRLFPEAKLAIGPAIENGFYYDFDLDRPLTPEDFCRKLRRKSRRLSRKTCPWSGLRCPRTKRRPKWKNRASLIRWN